MVQALAQAGCAVTLVLKAPVRTARLVDPLAGLPEVTVRRPHLEGLTEPDQSMSPRRAVRVLTAIDAERPYDLIVIRGRQLAHLLAHSPLAGRLWTYLTDVPQSAAEFTGARRGELKRIARASRFLLCQTEELRCFLESAVPATAGKCVLFPPVVVLPDELEPAPAPSPSPAASSAAERAVVRSAPLKLVYTGKFAPRWNTYEMTGLPRRLAAAGVPAELHMIGDKIHRDPADPGFTKRMRAALEFTTGVVWHGGHPRGEAMRLSAECDIALSWRDADLDTSLELSTKVLECGALGVPVVLNRTPMHERLLGADYPLFAATEDDVVDVLTAAGADPRTYALARDRCLAAAAGFSLDAAADRLTRYLRRAFPARRTEHAADTRRLRVGVAGHDLKFFSALLDYLKSRSDMEVRVDHWPALKVHDPKRSKEIAEWADVVVCEWCGPNAVWYAKHKRPGQRLVVRLHRFELYASWPGRLDIDAVDAVICVSPHYAELTRKITGWPESKVVVVPNWVDVDQLHRPKLEGVQHHIGFIGMAPSRKRLDVALDVLEELRRDDPRFTLFVKSKLPWDYWWIWQKDEERAHFEEVFRRVRRSPALAGAVVFDPFGPDVGAWLRRIGFVLSTSDDESFHLAPAEGMASGAIPALLNWPGADTIYDPHWIHATPAAMAASISATVRDGLWDDERRLAHAQVRDSYALDKVCAQFAGLLTGVTNVHGQYT
ncbi:MAG TPA: glycosyltransferase [Streptosporangiaceae bacterium]|nr:glycosyltransferase [Streptosporangiaceae bacterium]